MHKCDDTTIGQQTAEAPEAHEAELFDEDLDRGSGNILCGALGATLCSNGIRED